MANRSRIFVFGSVLTPVALYVGASMTMDHFDRTGWKFFNTGKDIATNLVSLAKAVKAKDTAGIIRRGTSAAQGLGFARAEGDLLQPDLAPPLAEMRIDPKFAIDDIETKGGAQGEQRRAGRPRLRSGGGRILDRCAGSVGEPQHEIRLTCPRPRPAHPFLFHRIVGVADARRLPEARLRAGSASFVLKACLRHDTT